MGNLVCQVTQRLRSELYGLFEKGCLCVMSMCRRKDMKQSKRTLSFKPVAQRTTPLNGLGQTSMKLCVASCSESKPES